MADNDRFYQANFRDRPVYFGDVGNRLQLSGFLLEGGGARMIVLSPNSSMETPKHKHSFGLDIIKPATLEEWWAIIRASDDPAVFELDSTGGIKAIHRKMRYAISGAVQQRIWSRDNFTCLYCGRKMGDVQLSIDHFIPLEYGGEDQPHNYVSACRKCNKDKGSTFPREYLGDVKYSAISNYLNGETTIDFLLKEWFY